GGVMARDHRLASITREQCEARLRRVREIAQALEFTGQVEHRHGLSESGGAQYCRGPRSERGFADRLCGGTLFGTPTRRTFPWRPSWPTNVGTRSYPPTLDFAGTLPLQ